MSVTSQLFYLAPAKLNLFLHITAQRPDGYHCLQTIFQFLDYSDVLHFDMRYDGQLVCQSNIKGLLPEQNLVLRAAHLLKQFSNSQLGVTIKVKKKIPIGGGLGGGSSNAATTLVALNRLWRLGLSNDKLAQLGLSLGADIPVFVYGHSAWAEGVGESLTPIDIDEPWYLVINPACHVSTTEIFNTKQLTRNTQPITMAQFFAGQSRNVCENVVRSIYPQIGQALDWLTDYSPARLTGTGACLFASFANYNQAKAILVKLPKQWQGFVARGKNISPLHEQIKSLSS